ncbi:MAG: glycosyltransferase [Acidimicrobiia bacterium]|nr:glycosyltransferase [Acidimicrobiia bacterium]
MSASSAPLISVLTPVFDTPPALLDEVIASVQAQTFVDWELLLVDDGSTAAHIGDVLTAAAASDARIKVLRRPANGGIVAASNDGLNAARGEFVAMLDHDDTLHPEALAAVAAVVAPDVDYVYTDSDLLDEHGRHSEPFFKPGWSPDRFRCQMYSNHLGVVRRQVALDVGGFREGFEGAQDYDLVFRVTEQGGRVCHVPRVLYHWRITDASVNASPDAKPYAWLASHRAIASHLERTGFEATVSEDMVVPGVFRLRPALSERPPVSIVIPTAAGRRDIAGEAVLLAERCLTSIVERSTYDNYELVLVVDDHVAAADVDRLRSAGGDAVRIVPFDQPFNFASKCNLGAVVADGDHLLLLNDDTQVITPEWIEHLLMYSRDPGVGAVGARLRFGDGRLQHTGLCFLPGVMPGHIYRGFQPNYGGYYAMVHLPGNFLAVTAACLMTPRQVYGEVGGLSEVFPGAYNDVDYCLKLHSRGLRIVYSPDAELYHHESSSREPEVLGWERTLLVDRWASRYGSGDPYYNPNFRQDSVDFVRPLVFADGTTARW